MANRSNLPLDPLMLPIARRDAHTTHQIVAISGLRADERHGQSAILHNMLRNTLDPELWGLRGTTGARRITI